jgi:RNA polymerase sigma-70 factor (ECF subfamily)
MAGTLEVRSWEAMLRRLAACRALDRLRQRRRHLTLDGVALPDGPASDPEAVALGREMAARLRDAIALLPNREATVFCLRYFDDLPYERIAEALKITPGAVATALHKARARLGSHLLEAVQEQP